MLSCYITYTNFSTFAAILKILHPQCIAIVERTPPENTHKIWTADWVYKKHGLGTKCGLRTEYKTWTRNIMRTTDCVYENSFRKVKLRETESELA